MTDQICQLMEDIEGLCKRCYHLQKSNNDMYDYLSTDQEMQGHIDENEKIIEKYHRKLDEIFQLIKEHQEHEKEIPWSPIAADYRRLEEAEKRSCDEKKRTVMEKIATNEAKISPDDQGVFL